MFQVSVKLLKILSNLSIDICQKLSRPYDLAQATFHLVTDQIKGLREEGFHPFLTQGRSSRAKELGARTLQKAACV